METLAGIVIVLIAIAASLVAERFRGRLLAVGVAACALGVAGFAFLFVGPKDYLVRFPGLVSILHPWLVALWGGLAIIFGLGLLLGVLGRMAFRWLYRHTGARMV